MRNRSLSLTFRITIGAASIAVLATLLVGGGSYFALRDQVQSSIQLAEIADNTDAANRASHLLNRLARLLEKQATSALAHNALSDSFSRDTYFVPHMRELAQENDLRASVTLVDFSTHELAHVGEFPTTGEQAPWLRDVIVESRAMARLQQRLDGRWALVLAEPVFKTGSSYASGALVLTAGLPDLARTTGSDQQPLIDDYITFGGQPLIWQMPGGEESIGIDSRAIQSALLLDMPMQDLTLRVLSIPSPDLDQKPLARLTLIFSACGILVLALAVAASTLWARRIVSPLRHLAEAAARFDLDDSNEFIAPDTPWNDEITQLAQSIQTMADRLNTAYQQLERRGRALLRNAEQVAGVGSWRLTPANGAMRWSDKMFDILEVPQTTLPTLNGLLNAIAVQDRDQLRQAIMTLTEKGQPFDLECALRPLPPMPRRILRISALAQLDGEEKTFDGTVQDITRERQDAEKLQAASDRIEAILNNTPVGIAILSIDRVILQANSAFGAIYGLSQDEMLGKTASILYSSDEEFADIGRRAYPTILNGGMFQDDVQMAHRGGHTIWVRLIARMVKLDDPRQGIVWAADDITERVENANLLAQTHAVLEQQARDLARSNAELEQFAYVASHDLRQPLRQVASYVTLLEREYADKLDEDGRTFIAFARSGAERMDKLIVDLLEYSRIGRKTRPMAVQSLDSVLAEARENLAVEINERKAALTIAAGHATVFGDRIELVRLFQNLIGNALKYCAPDRPPRIEITVASDTDNSSGSGHGNDDGDAVIVTIADNGIGIAAEYFDRIFGIFQRLHARDEYEGTGIGLAVCKKIVDHHHGRIWLDSVPGQGSRFHIRLPVQTLGEHPHLKVEEQV